MKKVLFLIISSMILLGSCQEYNNETKKELDTTVIVSLKEYENTSKEEVQEYFYSYLTNKIGYNYRKKDTFSNIANIISIKINSNDLSTIKELDIVDNAYKEIEYEMSDYSSNDPDYSYLVSNNVPFNYSITDMNIDSNNDGSNTLVAIFDTSLNYDHDSFKEISENKVRYSKSEVESIFNSNNFNASSLNYINNKVIYAYDYCDNDTEIKSSQTHGSHVASIVTSSGRYKGIAPSSQLAFFKVFNNYGSGCTTSVYLKALEDAYLLDVDAINMSFGSVLNYEEGITDYAVNTLISKINDSGINVFVASGNDGKNYFNNSIYKFNSLNNYETTSGSNLSTFYDTNSIGSYSSSESKDNIYFTDGINSYSINERNISKVSIDTSSYSLSTQILSKEYRFNDFLNEEIEYVKVPNIGSKEDYSSINVNNKIAIVQRGSIPFYEKIDNALKNNAKGLIIYSTSSDSNQTPYFSYKLQDNDLNKGYPTIEIDGIKYYDYTKINIPVAIITSLDAKTLLENNINKITFYKEKISSFSSQGGDPYLNIGVDLLAPGSNIYGAYSYGYYYSSSSKDYSNKGYLNDAYYFSSGTSMAAPNALGSYLSYLSTNELTSLNRKELRKLAINKIRSGTSILKDTSNNSYYSPRYQGNGLINISKALNNDSYLTYNNKSKIELKNNDDIKNGILNFNIDFNSCSEIEKEYKIKVTIEASKIIKHNSFKGEVTSNENIVLESYSFKKNLKNNDSISIYKELNDSSKEYLSKFENGTYLEGYIEVISSSEEISIPFLGYYGTNYELIKPYEDFDFEKDENSNITYESDIMNKYISDRLNIDINKVYSGSKILMGEDTNNGFENYFTYYKRNISTYNMPFTSEIINYKDPIIKKNNDTNKYSIYVNDTTSTRGLTIQLYMLKSMKEGKIYIDSSLQNDSLIENFVDINYYSYYKELFRSYPINSSSTFNDSIFHKTIGYIAYNPSLNNNIIISNGYHKLEFEFTTFNNTKLIYEYELYINETYVEKFKIYDVTLKNNLFNIIIEDEFNSIKSILINDLESINLLEDLDDNKYLLSLDYSSLKEDTYIEIINSNDYKLSLKIFINSDILFIYGDNVSKDTYIEKEEDTSILDDKTSYLTTYNILNLSSNNSKIYLGISVFDINNEYLYSYIIKDEYKISLLKNNDLYSFNISSNYFYKLKEIKNDSKDDKNNFNLIILLVVIITSLIVVSLIVIGIIFYYKNKKK